MPRGETGRQMGAGSRAGKTSKSSLKATRTPRKAKQVSVAELAISALPERVFQAHVVRALRDRGWIVWTVPNMTMTTRGLPDVIAVHPTAVPRRVLFYELKSQTGRVRPEQKVALAALGDVPGIDARIVRPSDWHALSEEV